jgi:hypothetical protein
MGTKHSGETAQATDYRSVALHAIMLQAVQFCAGPFAITQFELGAA